jgi:hypothetical protein
MDTIIFALVCQRVRAGTEAMLLSSLRPLLQNCLNVCFTPNDLLDVVGDSIVQLLGPIKLSYHFNMARPFFQNEVIRLSGAPSSDDGCVP